MGIFNKNEVYVESVVYMYHTIKYPRTQYNILCMEKLIVGYLNVYVSFKVNILHRHAMLNAPNLGNDNRLTVFWIQQRNL